MVPSDISRILLTLSLLLLSSLLPQHLAAQERGLPPHASVFATPRDRQIVRDALLNYLQNFHQILKTIHTVEDVKESDGAFGRIEAELVESFRTYLSDSLIAPRFQEELYRMTQEDEDLHALTTGIASLLDQMPSETVDSLNTIILYHRTELLERSSELVDPADR